MKIIYFLSIFLILFSCNQDSKKTEVQNIKELKYITKIEFKKDENQIKIISGGNSIVFQKDELPLNSAMLIPTSALAYMDELDLTDKIIGVSQPDFIFNPKIQRRLKENKTAVIGNFDEIFIEKILMNKPDVFFSTSVPTLAKFHTLLEKENIKVVYIDEYEELSPLAKAEYIKIFGLLFGKEKEADKIFAEIEKNYTQIQSDILKKIKKQPTVFVNQMYGDVWHMPTGDSFQAKLIKDAGGNYLWSSYSGQGSLNLTFENVFEKANDAEFWINAGDFPDKKTLIASYPHYRWFKAFKNGNIYNWYKRISPSGANDYFETGTARPDLVLKDLAAIFHPELFSNHELYFYKRLN